jgi:hypothetical protein
MPRPSLLGLILRLVIGFVILALLGFFLFNRLRRPGVKQATNPSPSPTSVVQITPTPQASATPTAEPEATASPKTTPKPKAQKPTVKATPKTVIIHSNPPVILIVHPGVKYNVDTQYQVEEQHK